MHVWEIVWKRFRKLPGSRIKTFQLLFTVIKRFGSFCQIKKEKELIAVTGTELNTFTGTTLKPKFALRYTRHVSKDLCFYCCLQFRNINFA